MTEEEDDQRFPRLSLRQFLGAILRGIGRLTGMVVVGYGPDPITPVVNAGKKPEDKAQG